MDLRFGISIIPSASGRSDPVAEAVHAEELGFDIVSVWDHPLTETPSLETWTLLSFIAARTSRVRLLSNVLGLPYRPPLVLAKMAETLDRLSGGRFILGLGAGSSRRDWSALALPDWPTAQRVEALEEALEVIRGAWAPGELWFAGKHFQVRGGRLEPKPERPIPIWLGVYGGKTVRIAGRLADGWLPSMPYAPPEHAARVREVLLETAREAGRDPDAITCAYNVGVRVGGPPSEEPNKQVAGEPEAVAERLAELVRLGFTTLNFWVSGDRGEQRERLAREVMPAVRNLVR